jgi:restriction system protein
MKDKRRLNIRLPSELEKQLEELAKNFGPDSKTEAIRLAVQELKKFRELLPQGSYDLHTDIKPSNVFYELGLDSAIKGVFDPRLKVLHFTGHGLMEGSDLLLEFPPLAAPAKPISTLIISALIEPDAKVADGLSIQAITISWQEIVKHLERNWDHAHEIPPEKWEEIIAGAFKKEGYDEVILTPRSDDKGRDVIAIRKGIGTVKILGSVKAYGPGRLVRHDDVRALVGVLAMEPDSSKGIITTTSDFAPKVYTNTQYKALMPTRLELVNGKQLQEWLAKLAKK